MPVLLGAIQPTRYAIALQRLARGLNIARRSIIRGQ